MSSDHHDSHGGGAPENKNSLFFLVGIIVIIAVIGIGSTGRPANPVRLPGPPQPALFPTNVPLPNIPESTPSYRQSILDAPGPIPNRVKKEPQVASIAPWGYALTFASKIKVVSQFLEGTSLQKVQTIKTVNVGPDGPMVEQAAVRMTPVEIQELNLKLITYPQHMTGNHVQCYYDEDGGNRHVPDENVFQPDAIQWNTFRGGAVMNHAIMSTGTLPLEGFNLFMTQPDETVTPQNGLNCYTQSDYTGHIGLYELGDTEEIYKSTDHNQWTANEFCSAGALAKYDECMAAPPEPDPNNPGQYKKKSCDLRCSGDAHTVYSLRLPDADNVNINSGEGPGGEKEGFTLTQLDKVFDFEKGNGFNTQNHTLRIPLCEGCDITSETSVYYLEDNRRTYILAFNCALADKYAPDYPTGCPTPPPVKTDEEFECPIDIIEKMKPKDTACKLCNMGSLKNFLTPALEAKAVPNGLSPLAIKVLEQAADTYHVPAALLVATMLHEGSFSHPETWTWSSDDNVRKFSSCKTKKPMPSCDAFAHPVTGAKGPFGFIDHWWDLAMQSGGPYKYLLEDPEFKKKFAKVNSKNLSSCNFVDAAFMSARELGIDQSHLYVPGIPLSCPATAGFPGMSIYQGGDIPQSCSVWKSDRVALARLQYGDRICSADTGRVVAMYNAMKCGGGN